MDGACVCYMYTSMQVSHREVRSVYTVLQNRPGPTPRAIRVIFPVARISLSLSLSLVFSFFSYTSMIIYMISVLPLCLCVCMYVRMQIHTVLWQFLESLLGLLHSDPFAEGNEAMEPNQHDLPTRERRPSDHRDASGSGVGSIGGIGELDGVGMGEREVERMCGAMSDLGRFCMLKGNNPN